MKLTKNRKIAIGILTLWPIIYIFMFMFYTLAMIFMDMQGSQGWRPKLFFIIFILHYFTIFCVFGLIGFYLYYLFKTDKVPKDKKALWAALIFLGNMFAMPVFWFLYIWNEPKTNDS